MMESAAKTCHIRVIDWKSTFLRKGDRWVATEGPSKLCGAVRIFTLIPHDVNKMKESLGPGLWTFQGKVVVTDEAADPVCADPKTMPLIANLVDGAMSVSWNAPRKTVECSEFEFFSALEKDLLFK